MRRRKMEPESECRCGGAGCHSGGFLLRIMPPSWQPVPACVRHGHSEGGPFLYATTIVLQAEPFFFAATTIVLQAGRSYVQQRWCCRRNQSQAHNPAAIPKFTPSNQESLQYQDHFPRNLCSDSQIDPLKSRITAHGRPFPGKTLQRFPN